MKCKFSTNGIAIDYSGTVKPCCVFIPNESWKKQNHVSRVDFRDWHQTPDVSLINRMLDQDTWPDSCKVCQDMESYDRGDSIRLNGEQSYGHYDSQDITLEIRGGNVCNFACQTCWPAASTRVAQFYKQAGIPILSQNDMEWDFDSLLPIRHRIKNIQLLGGEPFYDRRCLAFLDWLKKHDLDCDVCIFTNGSVVSRSLLQSLPGRITLVWSIDAVGTPAEYIRFGTQWTTVEENFLSCQNLPNVENRVNITTSPYNLYYLHDLFSWLAPQWPQVVTFGVASTSSNSRFMTDCVFPLEQRPAVIERLCLAIDTLQGTDIEHYQKINAVNAVTSIKRNLESLPWNQENHTQLLEFISKMDAAKHINIADYCPETAACLEINDHTRDKVSSVFLTGDK